MTAAVFCLLTELQRPLLGKFYRAHQSPMRASGEGAAWVARREEIIAGLLLTAVADGQWLTGLFVAPTERRQGLARQLIDQALAHAPGPVWLFCEPALAGFYQGLGFELTEQLPAALASRLARYRRSKTLLALHR